LTGRKLDGVGQFPEPGQRLHAVYINSAPVLISLRSAMQEQAEIAGAIRKPGTHTRVTCAPLTGETIVTEETCPCKYAHAWRPRAAHRNSLPHGTQVHLARLSAHPPPRAPWGPARFE
jgi:hypothetical protein